MVCQECGVNTAIVNGHSRLCSQYEQSRMTDEEYNKLRGVDSDDAEKLRKFGDAINDVVIERGEKSLLAFLSSIDINEGDPGYAELRSLAHICLTVGAGITIQILIEQGILDPEAVRQAAGV